jgi:hypothetical protein
MEAENQNASVTVDVADEATENRAEIPIASSTTNSEDHQNSEEAGTSSNNTNSTTENKAPVKRNYRRRTESGDESSSISDSEPPPTTVNPVEEDQPTADASEEDVSLEELRVSGSEEEPNRSARR